MVHWEVKLPISGFEKRSALSVNNDVKFHRLVGRKYYKPTYNGKEKNIAKRL